MSDQPPMIEAALAAARGHGCTCDPDVTLTELAVGVSIANVRHDHACRLLTRRASNRN